MDISVIVVNFNSGRFLRQYIDSLFGFGVGGRGFEVLVIDCASPIDQSADLDYVRQRGARVIELERNVGYAAACNLGLRETHGDYVVFSNADILANDRVLFDLANVLAESPDVAVATPAAYMDPDRLLRIPNFHPVTRRALCGEAMRAVSNRLADRHGDARARSRVEFWRSEGVTEHENVHGALIACRRETIDALGGFDAGYPLYYEDTDLFTRARAAGYRLVCQHAIEIVHLIHRSSITVWAEAMARQQLGRRRYVRTHLGPIADGIDRVASRVVRRSAQRSNRPFEQLGALTQAPVFDAVAESGSEVLFELAFDPHFLEAAGHFVVGDTFALTPASWASLNHGGYFARTLALDDFVELRRWQFEAAPSLISGTGS